MRKFGDRVRLIHKLGQLAASEKFLDGAGDRPDVDEVTRVDFLIFLRDAHSFLDNSFQTADTDAELVLQKFADGAYAAVCKVIDVVDVADAVSETEVVASVATISSRVMCFCTSS